MTLPLPPVHSWEELQFALDVIAKQFPLGVLSGTGTPEGAVTASPPAIYLNRSGGAGTTLYVKESGVNTNTGWSPK